MKKIVITSNTSFSIYNFRLNLMKALKQKGFEVYAVAPEDRYSVYLKEFKFSKINNLDRKGKNFFKDIKLLIEYIKTYNKIKPDLVLNFTIKPNIYSSIACKILGIKSISVITGLGYVYVKGGFLKKITDNLYKFSLQFNEKVVFQNAEDKELFVKNGIVDRKKAVLIRGSGVDTEYFSKNCCKGVNKTKNTIFLMVSRILFDKGVMEFVNAGKLLKKRFPDTEFWLLGPVDIGNPSSIKEDLMKKWENEGIIKYFREAEDIRPFLCKADCVVLPSFYREGLPRVLLEAMSMEKPIITTNITGCRDLCENGVNGFLVSPKNTEDLAKAMENFINLSKEERIKMGKAGRKKVLEEFDEKIVIQKYMDLIENIFTKKSGGTK